MNGKLLEAIKNEDSVVEKTENMFTTSEYGKAIGVTRSSARARLEKLEAAGKLRRVHFMERRFNGSADSVLIETAGWEYIGAGR